MGPAPLPTSSARLPSGWWASRWHLFRSPAVGFADRVWALSEIGCALVSLATIALALYALTGLSAVPAWTRGWQMQILLAGAVGYGTNFVAVQMLFKPRDPIRWWPMRWIWRQGLIPARQEEMARIVGEEVATRLLTPRSIADEVANLVEAGLEDRKTIQRVVDAALEMLERELPHLLRRFLPDAAAAVRDGLREAIPASELKRTIGDIVDDWFADRKNREALVAFILAFLRERTPDLVELLKRTVKRYKKKSALKSFALTTGEISNVLDWKALEAALKKQLDRPKAYDWAARVVEKFSLQARSFTDRVVDEGWLTRVAERTGDYALERVEEFAETNILPKLASMLASEGFRKWVLEELVPDLKPRIVEWIEAGHLEPVLARFDVRGRVAAAARAMPVAELEDMANRVGARHLGAIQVLGYALGLIAGVLIALIGRSG